MAWTAKAKRKAKYQKLGAGTASDQVRSFSSKRWTFITSNIYHTICFLLWIFAFDQKF
jgi:hypothetical protein